MADNASASLPKALKVLNIKRRTNLLGLPRELRDVIYEYALVQPSYWDKPHEPQCPLIDLEKAWQWPVYRTWYETVDEIVDNRSIPGTPIDQVTRMNPLTDGQVNGCFNAGCHSRLGINLRLANRQVFTETEDIFWTKNTFCYSDPVMMVHDLADCVDLDGKNPCGLPGPCGMYDMPKSVKAKIRRLSLLDCYIHYELALKWDQQGLIVLMLNMLPNLTEVELPARIAVAHLTEFSKVHLPHLTTVHATDVQALRVGSLADSARIDLHQSKSIAMPTRYSARSLYFDCGRFEITNSQPDSSLPACRWCYVTLRELAEDRLGTWIHRFQLLATGPDRVMRTADAVKESLKDNVPGQLPQGEPLKMVVRIDGRADKGEVVKLHGLPVIDAAARLELHKAERKQKSIKASILPGVRSRKRANLHFPPADKEVVVPCRKAKRRERQRPVLDLRERLPQPDERSERLALRAERHEEEARVESQERKSDAEASAMEMNEAMQQLSLDRNAAKKRSGRR
ncbi:hypothetical protein LTR10_002682 [Elasticomyces elasticus]|nr:hypothetical protein LTR10_002682 [Elasticomyces elasticus]KAK4967976.1 hypothetical protein LTR42_010304 [Elasticomyces elasticus]